MGRRRPLSTPVAAGALVRLLTERLGRMRIVTQQGEVSESIEGVPKVDSRDQGGLLKFIHGGEYHAYNPDVIGTLQKAVQGGSYDDYKAYAALVNEREPMVLRDLLDLKLADQPLAIDDVGREVLVGQLSKMSEFSASGHSLEVDGRCTRCA